MSYTKEEKASMAIQAIMKSVINNYPTKEAWNEGDEVEILKRVGVGLSVFKHHYKAIINQMKGRK